MRQRKVRPIPLTSEIHYKKTIKEQNAENRDRSKSHERRVAALLKGNRVPLSGAHAAYKGDVVIEFINHPGKYIIECKLSAQVKNGIPRLFFLFTWFEKLEQDAKSMNARFGVFVLHYHRHSILDDYVLIRASDVDKILARYTALFTDEITQLMTTAPIYDIRYLKSGLPRKSINLEQTTVENHIISVNGVKGARLMTPNGIYLLISLATFRDIMNNV